jgi:hypothetical protein
MIKKMIVLLFCLFFLSACGILGNGSNDTISKEPITTDIVSNGPVTTDTVSTDMITPTQYPTVPYPDLGYPIIKRDDEDIGSRIEDFKEKLTIAVEVINIFVEHPSDDNTTIILDLNISLQNMGKEEIILRKPLQARIDFYSNIKIAIESLDGSKVKFPINFIYYVKSPLICDSEDDFISLRPGETLNTLHKVELPNILSVMGIDTLESFNLFIRYSNYDVGYQLSPKEWMSSQYLESLDFGSIDEYTEWLIENTIIVDLNAWVGVVETNKILVELP